jgi:hypothetical protein
VNKIYSLTTALALLALLTACGGSAPSALELGERTPVRIGLTGVTMDLEIEQAGFYTLFTDGNEDTVCSIRDQSGREVAEDDDGGEDFNCMISTLLSAGRYAVEVRGYDVGSHGRSHVTIEQLPTRSISPGEVASLSIQAMQGQVLDIGISQAGTYRLGTSGRFDTECWLFDQEGVELDYNDDFGGDQNCGMVQPLRAGRYHVLIKGYDGAAGNTTFIATQVPVREVTLGLGTPAPDRLNQAEDMVDFQVTLDQPGLYVFYTSGETDTYCELRAANDELLAYNDDGEDQNCRIQHALEAGQYRFHVRGYRGNTGDFVAHATRR